MLRLLKNRKGQNAAEYAIVIGLVIAAAIAMQTYVKRGINAKIKDGTDVMTSVTDTVVGSYKLGTTQQYEPDYVDTNFSKVTRASTITDAVKAGGAVDRTITKDDSDRAGTHKITYP
ncbi:MAG: hypothetical protein COV72_05720 [Candidatus Omnitrophica bacterium CG11_big_fil_rev_8_21_14_0_20_42_13]|uniref:Uncharacterized protein n=1 Tax=Candidatus Ghiorseimicrobium undicola TaxID=1974746 RepID=A0A2H0LX18_9BACT|nr:MAG: hypothetical protein COV72_05720 [Candidatus Omnitrophica bacterium CG11_big_fil_rev_8_21_14_0_20_42_13]